METTDIYHSHYTIYIIYIYFLMGKQWHITWAKDDYISPEQIAKLSINVLSLFMTRSAHVVCQGNDVSIYFTSTRRPYEPFWLLSGCLDFYGWIPIVFFNNMFLCKWGLSKIVDPQNHRFQLKHDYHKLPNPWEKKTPNHPIIVWHFHGFSMT